MDGSHPSTTAHLPDRDLARLVHELADAVIIADVTGEITLWNPAATAMFGWSAEHALGRSLDLIIPERHRERHWAGYERVMATGTSEYASRLLEVPAMHRDGRTLSIAFTVTVMCDDGGAVTAIAAVVRDDTDRRAELQRLRAGSAPG